jgi:hypothetical protein
MKSKAFAKKDLQKAFDAGQEYEASCQNVYIKHCPDFENFYKLLIKNDQKKIN